jgi:hypothetical protein
VATLTDDQLMMVIESTYNTPLAVTRTLPVQDGTEFDWDNRAQQGHGMQVGTPGDLGARYLPINVGQGTGKIKCDLQSKLLGLLFQLSHGVANLSTVVAGTSQILAHGGITGTVLPSATVQLATPRNDGTMDPVTYSGVTATGFEIEMPEDDFLTISVDLDARSKTRATGLGTPGVATGYSLFHHSGAGGSAVHTLSTTAITVPTATALASGGGSPVAIVRGWKLAANQNADTDRRIAGGRNQPTRQSLSATLSLKVEYNDLSLITAWEAGTPLSFTSTITTGEALTSGNFAVYQLAVPQLYITKGALPKPALGKTVITDIDAELKFNAAGDRLWYSVLRTADVAL